MNDRDPLTPDGCRLCGVEQRYHYTQVCSDKFGGLHQWVEPTNEQRLERMKARRRARGLPVPLRKIVGKGLPRLVIDMRPAFTRPEMYGGKEWMVLGRECDVVPGEWLEVKQFSTNSFVRVHVGELVAERTVAHQHNSYKGPWMGGPESTRYVLARIMPPAPQGRRRHRA